MVVEMAGWPRYPPASVYSCAPERITGEPPTIRRAAYVILLDDTRRVPLVRFAYRGSNWWREVGWRATRSTKTQRGGKS